MKVVSALGACLLLSVFWLFFTPPTVTACSCAGQNIYSAVIHSEAVFSGTVTEIVDPHEGATVISGGWPLHYAVKVGRVWKGRVPPKVIVLSARSSAACGCEFKAGEAYLLFCGEDSLGYRTGLCTRTKPLAVADEDLSFLMALPLTGDPDAVDSALVASQFPGLESSDQSKRIEAIRRVDAGKLKEQVIPKLVKLCRTGTPEDFRAAIPVLAGMGKKDSVARTVIKDALHHGDSSIRSTAILSLRRINLDEEFLMSCLVAALQDSSDEVRIAGAVELSGLWGEAEPVMADIMIALDDENPQVRSLCAQALGRLRAHAVAAIPKLVKLGSDSSEVVRVRANYALMNISPESPEVHAALKRSLQHDPATRIRESAFWFLDQHVDEEERLEIRRIASEDSSKGIRQRAGARTEKRP